MHKKEKSAFSFKTLIFSYLAISKLMYWINTIATIQQDELGEVWRMVLNRILTQDIMLILVLAALFLLEHYITTHPSITNGLIKGIMVHVIGYIIYLAIITLYVLALNFFADIQIANWGGFIFDVSIFYILACVVLEIKDHMKKKEAEMYIPVEQVDKNSLSLLSTLYKRDVLTKDEYESKKAAISNLIP